MLTWCLNGIASNLVHQLGMLFEVGAVSSRGLYALTHTAEHDGDQGSQRQIASTNEGVVGVGVAG